MNLTIALLLLLLPQVSTTPPSPQFCLCALRTIRKDYSLLTTDRPPPKYHSPNGNDIGFFVVPSNWKPVNNATWTELSAMINAPAGIYSHISLNGINPINSGVALDSRRSAYLGDILSEYQFIEDQTPTCLEEAQPSAMSIAHKDQWQKFFRPRTLITQPKTISI